MTTTHEPAMPAVRPAAAAAISGHFDSRTAATEIAQSLSDGLGQSTSCDICFIFGSFHHTSALDDAAALIRNTINAETILGVSAESVLGGDQEMEGLAGMSAIAMRLPGVSLQPWRYQHKVAAPRSTQPSDVATFIGMNDDTRGVIMLADPFTTSMTKWLPALNACSGSRHIPICGGMASGASQPGHNVLVYNDKTYHNGAVGVTIGGDVSMDFIVSQGCRPIGQTMVVTKCEKNIVQELGGRKPIDVLQELAQAMSEQERSLLSRGLLLGFVINEYKERFGRGDFLVRNILGLDQKTGAIAVGDVPRVGQTVQFHVRDAETADEDLQLLLDAQVLDEPPFASMLFTCNGRGQRMFSESNHDVRTIHDRLGDVALAGFFAGGEIGPIGDQSFLHGHTASLAVLRGA